ncbi:hypothetical protein EYF80_023278 [Liparis tanakae]|uniref:Uncharacterized protein n=1 Tax=Liparis tanakae TaxID=230148 RepID=A0A4Z2HMH9_9TELE|nr:hypothetical protein EYF80_023278 [Liparis tanakae]
MNNSPEEGDGKRGRMGEEGDKGERGWEVIMEEKSKAPPVAGEIKGSNGALTPLLMLTFSFLQQQADIQAGRGFTTTGIWQSDPIANLSARTLNIL